MKTKIFSLVIIMALFTIATYAAVVFYPGGTDTWPDGTKMFTETVDEDFYGTLIPKELRRELHTYADLIEEKGRLEGNIVHFESRITLLESRITEINWMISKFPTP